MRTIRIKLYKFSELSDKAKETAIYNYRINYAGNDPKDAWEDTLEDAKQIGLKIISLSDHRSNEGEFMLSACEVAANIFRDHGEDCETYKTAASFMEEWEPVFSKYIETEEEETKLMDIEDEFLKSLLEDYRIILNKNYEYANSDEAIIDTIEANEYEFTKDGKLN